MLTLSTLAWCCLQSAQNDHAKNLLQLQLLASYQLKPWPCLAVCVYLIDQTDLKMFLQTFLVFLLDLYIHEVESLNM